MQRLAEGHQHQRRANFCRLAVAMRIGHASLAGHRVLAKKLRQCPQLQKKSDEKRLRPEQIPELNAAADTRLLP